MKLRPAKSRMAESVRDWRSHVASLTPHATFFPPVDDTKLREAEGRLGVGNGVRGEHELGLVWSVEQMVADNLMFRTRAEFAQLYMPFEPLLFFADAGNGDQFAYTIVAGEVRGGSRVSSRCDREGNARGRHRTCQSRLVK